MSVVAKRSSMTYFSDGRDHYSHRVRIVLAEKGVSVDVVEVEPNQIPPDIAEFNPYNSLPILHDRDLVLYESKVMMEYLDERFPHPPLLPVYPIARAQSRLWIHRIEKDWTPLVDLILRNNNKSKVDLAAKELKEGLLSIGPIFNEMPFFMSEEFTLVDCCLAPILWRLDTLGIRLTQTRQTKPLMDYMERLFARMPSPSNNGESSSSGWSFFSNGNCTFCDGVVPKWFLYACSMRSMHLRGPTHRVPSSSRKQSHPRWKSTGPVPLSLKEWGLACNSSMMCCGFRDAMIKSSTHTPMHSQ